MTKKIPLQTKTAIGGDDTFILTEKTDNDKVFILPQIIEQFANELRNIAFGGCSLIVNVRNGRCSFRIEKIVSIQVANHE